MTEIIKNPAHEFLLTQVKSSKKHIVICTPHIDETILEQIITSKNEQTFISLITNNNIAKYLFKHTNLDILNQMLDRHYKVYNYQQLHANIYIFDHKYVWITSSELTKEGLVSNFEYGLFTSESDIVDDVLQDYHHMINSDACGKIKKNHVLTIQKQIKSMDINQVNLDLQGDYVLTNQNVIDLTKQMNGWKKTILDSIHNNIKNSVFKLKDVYAFIDEYRCIYPDNNHIEAKIRQVLQELRDIGYLKFINNKGVYKKLWK